MNAEAMQSSYWAVITAPVLESRKLSDGAKLFYAEISRRTNQRGYCWASNQSLAEALSLGERSVSRYVSELEAEGFITSEIVGVKDRKRHVERRIRLAVPAPFRADAPADLANSGEVNIAKSGEVNIANSGEVKVAKSGEVKVANSGEVNVANSGEVHKENNKSMNNNPPEPPSGGKRAPEAAKWKAERFEAFWRYYRTEFCKADHSRAGERAAAARAWDKLKADDATLQRMADKLVAVTRTDQHKAGYGIPYASTWLNKLRRGEIDLDEMPVAGRSAPAAQQEGWGWQ